MTESSTPLWIALSLCVSSCAAPAEQRPRARMDEQTAAPFEPAGIPAEVLATLRGAAVTHDDYARRILYTWSSPEGVAKSRAARQLLLPSAAEGHFAAEIDALATDPGNGASLSWNTAHDVARMLSTHPSFAARRYAWTRPFATREPLGARSYGDELIAVVLKPSAVIARFDAQDEVPFRFSDLDGNEVPLGRVLADPSTLAAVYHVGTNPESGARYREFVLCNESMIAEWSVATEAIARVLSADLRAVRALAAFSGSLADEPASPRWEHAEEGVRALYAASLAFDTERHRPTPANLERLSASLAAVERPARGAGAPLVMVPTITFTSLVAGPPAVPPLPPGFGVQKRRIYVCD